MDFCQHIDSEFVNFEFHNVTCRYSKMRSAVQAASENIARELGDRLETVVADTSAVRPLLARFMLGHAHVAALEN